MVRNVNKIKNSDQFMYNATAYGIYSGDVKSTYSAEVSFSKFEVDVVCNKLDVDSAVDNWIDEKKPYWEPLQEEVNKFADSFK